jgi:hypothetical protein
MRSKRHGAQRDKARRNPRQGRPGERPARRTLQVEALEERTLLAVQATLNAGILSVSLDAKGDTAQVGLSPNPGEIRVTGPTSFFDFNTSDVQAISIAGTGPSLSIDPTIIDPDLTTQNQTVVLRDNLVLTKDQVGNNFPFSPASSGTAR